MPYTSVVVGPTAREQVPILCLEDDPHLGYALTRTLAPRRVELVDRVAKAKASILAHYHQAWLLDVSVPDGSGLDVLEWARSRGDATPTLVMTALDDRAVVNRAQELGAEFVFKPYSPASLDAFLLRVEAANASNLRLARATEQLVVELDLPRRERDIVRALVRGVARADLARELGVSENTVKTTIRKLLARTGDPDVEALLRALLRRTT